MDILFPVLVMQVTGFSVQNNANADSLVESAFLMWCYSEKNSFVYFNTRCSL